MNRFRIAMLCLSLLALAGCLFIGQRKPVAVYTLGAAPAPVKAPAPDIGTALAVQLPAAAGLLDSTAILVSSSSGELRVYAGVRWNKRPAQLLRERLLAGLAAAGFSHAVPAQSMVLTTYTLGSDLEDFHAVIGAGKPHVRVVLQVRLIDNASRQLCAQRRFTVERAAQGVHAAALVTAFAQTANALAAQVAHWSVVQLKASAHHAAPPH